MTDQQATDEQTTHSPGPWFIGDDKQVGYNVTIGNAAYRNGQIEDSHQICDVRGPHKSFGVPRASAAADAYLIAAAPDLLDACDDQGELIRKAQAILTEHLQPDGLSEDEAISRLLLLLDGPYQRTVQDSANAAIAKAKGTP